MRRFVVTLICAALLMTGCSNTDVKETSAISTSATTKAEESSKETIEETTATEPAGSKGQALYNAFISELNASSDIFLIANNLSKESVSGYDCVVNDYSEGFLNGFDADISGFSKCVGFSPMIGSIPFVTYIFETDNPDELKTTLLEHADPCWNICTEADETVCEVSGNYVFFVMCVNE